LQTRNFSSKKKIEFFQEKLEALEKVTLHLRPLSKEGTFFTMRLTTGKRTAQARRFGQLEKKATEKIVG
jgi:hypothetical protein